MENNLVYDTAFTPFEWHNNPGVPEQPGGPGVAPTRVVNNVFVASAQNGWYAEMITRNQVLKWDGYVPAEFSHNVVYLDAKRASSRHTMLGGVPCGRNEQPGPNCTANYLDSFKEAKFNNNVYWNSSGTITPSFPGASKAACAYKINYDNCATFAEWQESGHDNASLAADPFFKDPAKNDYTITNAAVLALGVVPLDLSMVGPDW